MDHIERVFGDFGLLAKAFPGYTPRPQQRELASRITETVKEADVLLAEAPTGVGKSFAGLVPAANIVMQEQRPVVVVTSSILLQEQYMNKDIPFLESLFDTDLHAELIKGRNNYLCALKATEQAGINLTLDTPPEEREQREAIETWWQHTKTGDMSELPIHPSYAMWSNYAAVDDHDCIKKECAFYDSCFYYTKRRRLLTAKLIICNYHYYFTAFQAGPESGMLPSDARLTVFDEGHEMAAVARNFLERRFSYAGLKISFMRLFGGLKRLKGMSLFSNPDVLYEQWNVESWLGEMHMVFEQTAYLFSQVKSEQRDYVKLDPDHAYIFRGVWENSYQHLRSMAKRIALHATSCLDASDPASWNEADDHDRAYYRALTEYHDRLQGYADLLNLCFSFDDKLGELEVYQNESFDVVKWLTLDRNREVVLCVKPSIAAPFTERIFESAGEDQAFVILSATLATNRSFDHLKKELGVPVTASDLIVSSPFALEQNLLWYLPKDIPAGNDPAHLPAVMIELERIINALGGKTLALFTSVKNLTYAKHHLTRVLPRHIEVLAQGDDAKERLVQRMRQSPNVVLLGTRSFFTGVDIPGPNLSAVVLDKLPFPMMGEPVNDHLMNKPGGFFDFTLPDTIMTLKQAFGRLNRTATDRGLVAVLDGRLGTARYKNQFFNSFEFKIQATREWQAAESYLRQN